MNIPSTLKENAATIVQNLDQESIDAYLFIKKQYSETIDIRDNYLFHFVYRSFYRLDNAGLSKKFKSEYFNLMQEVRINGELDLSNICNKLYQFVNLKGQNTLQFSFATKMVNTINDELPIYDSEVASIFKFRTPYNYKPYETRLKEYCEFYEKLKKRYSEFVASNDILYVFSLLKSYLSHTEELSNIKKLDFIMWSAGKLKSINQLRDRAKINRVTL